MRRAGLTAVTLALVAAVPAAARTSGPAAVLRLSGAHKLSRAGEILAVRHAATGATTALVAIASDLEPLHGPATALVTRAERRPG